MSNLSKSDNNFDLIYQRIRDILKRGRNQALQAVNAEMVHAYWDIGRKIVEEEQRGQVRADYGSQLIKELSSRLTQDFGKGFIARNLWSMRDFYLTYPKVNALRSQLSWTHYRILLRVSRPEARGFYEAECVKANWSTRELERQIASLLYERLALSRNKNEAVVRYTLNKSTQQVFASRYQLYLPTEDELRAALQQERQRIEQVQRLQAEGSADA